MQSTDRKERKFKNRLLRVLQGENLSLQGEFFNRLTVDLGCSPDELGAALIFMSQSNLYENVKKPERSVERRRKPGELLNQPTKSKRIRYRLDVGSHHKLCPEQLKDMLVEESGVERQRIGKVDIRNHYTIVELPEGMPSDIFQVLTETEICQRKLKIKRLKSQRSYRPYRNQGS